MDPMTPYLAAWNERDPDERTRLVALAFTDDGTYTDPLSDVRGPQAIAAMIGAVQAQYPDHTLSLVSPVEQHHDLGRFAWEIRSPNGELLIDGLDVVQYADDGRFGAVAGFFGRALADLAA